MGLSHSVPRGTVELRGEQHRGSVRGAEEEGRGRVRERRRGRIS